MTDVRVLVFRLGAAVLLITAVVLAVVAVTVDNSTPSGQDLQVVEDPADIALPALGLFGGEVVVYGMADRASVRPAELGCALVSRSGGELSSAKMSDLKVRGREALTVGGIDVQPLFAVSSYPTGARIACAEAAGFAPLALLGPTTFGGNADLVRVTAAAAAIVCLLVAAVGWVLGSRRR